MSHGQIPGEYSMEATGLALDSQWSNCQEVSDFLPAFLLPGLHQGGGASFFLKRRKELQSL